MLVAIRIRPLSTNELSKNEQEIIRAEDKLLVSTLICSNSCFSQIVLDRVEMECENEGKKPDVLHRSRE